MPNDLIKKATQMAQEIVDKNYWDGEDDWFPVDEYHDINIYRDMDNRVRVSMFPVSVNGNTTLEKWTDIDIVTDEDYYHG